MDSTGPKPIKLLDENTPRYALRVRRPEPLIDVWRRVMPGACGGEAWASPVVKSTAFNSHVRLMRAEGKDDYDIRRLIVQFATEIGSRRLRIEHKDAWLVFVKTWRSIRHDGVGLIQADSDESWI